MGFTFLRFDLFEIILIIALILIVFGPERLPSAARALGRSIGEFRRAVREFKDEVNLGEDDATQGSQEAREGRRIWETLRGQDDSYLPEDPYLPDVRENIGRINEYIRDRDEEDGNE